MLMDESVNHWLTPLQECGLVPEGVVAAFVVGSAARGWHNARSDFDIYVVTRAERVSATSRTSTVPLDPAYVRSEVFHRKDRRWEVTYWLERQIGQALSKVSWEAYEGGRVTEEALTRREELLLAHLGTCFPVLGQDWITRTRERLVDSAFRSFVVVRSLGAADDAVEDALGQMEAGDLESATISARMAFGHAIDALLEAEGEYGSHLLKWRPNRFRACAPRALSFDEYWKIETMQGYDPVDPRPWIKNVLTICQDIAMRVDV
ncbi:hypothetical protein ACM01_24715 [Streptomyces viridochromogenes]|uniref:Polymerase nucleotidyl transferase domain-containing protein n=2 Tax=Streptomyces viridochromogenes TaxID=1938 RepID=A0A0J7ZAD0_STRVR|nr:hypothetical protein ACM01_24715 [Streptomyces viridochromogenes]